MLDLQTTAGNRATIHYLQQLAVPTPPSSVHRSDAQPVVQRNDSLDFKTGFNDANTGQQKNGIPRIGAALDDYNNGYVKGLDEQLKRAKAAKDYPVIAEVLNAFNIDDILPNRQPDRRRAAPNRGRRLAQTPRWGRTPRSHRPCTTS